MLLGARGFDFVVFYHWDTAKIIRKIDVNPKLIIWNDSNYLLALVTTEDLYFLTFRNDLLEALLNSEEKSEGYEESFDIGNDLSEQVNLFYLS